MIRHDIPERRSYLDSASNVKLGGKTSGVEVRLERPNMNG